MKSGLRVAGVVVGLLLLGVVLETIAAESGEVVVLTTRDVEDQPRETRLWVVDLDGHAWLRAGSDVQSWYGRLTQRPEVELERGGGRASYRAVPEPERQGEVNRLMLEKYGWADRYIGFLFGRDDAVPIRLDPR